MHGVYQHHARTESCSSQTSAQTHYKLYSLKCTICSGYDTKHDVSGKHDAIHTCIINNMYELNHVCHKHQLILKENCTNENVQFAMSMTPIMKFMINMTVHAYHKLQIIPIANCTHETIQFTMRYHTISRI